MDTVAKPTRRPESLYLGYDGRTRSMHHAEAAPAAAHDGEPVRTRDGETLILRSIHADDVAALLRGFDGLTAEEVRMRFLHPLTELPEALARKLCDIDPEHAVAIVLTDAPGTANPEIHAVARAYIDPVTLAAEFALVVQNRLSRQGIGTLLMRRLIAACRERGASEIWGDVLSENGAMLELCDRLGFVRQSVFHDPGVVRVKLGL